MKTIDFSYFIERYNADEMSDAEKHWFQKELKSNKDLSVEINLRRKSDEILRRQDIISLRNKLTEIEKRREEAIPVKKTKIPTYFYYAAAIAVFMVIGSTAIFPGKKLSNDEIVLKYNKQYEPQTAQRSGLADENADFLLALEYYNTHDFANAAILFKKVVEVNPKDMEYSFLYGVANFEDKKYPEAEEWFVKVINNGKNLFTETAKWYLALCYVQTNDREKAYQQLDIISKEGSIYSKDAKKIMRRLN